jgi:hypothetical protein
VSTMSFSAARAAGIANHARAIVTAPAAISFRKTFISSSTMRFI